MNLYKTLLIVSATNSNLGTYTLRIIEYPSGPRNLSRKQSIIQNTFSLNMSQLSSAYTEVNLNQEPHPQINIVINLMSFVSNSDSHAP